jgi:hypothetical protein
MSETLMRMDVAEVLAILVSRGRREALMAPRDQVLDELTELAAVEHAVIAEYLQIAYVLGHRMPDPAPGPAGPAIADAAQNILSMAPLN